MTFCDNVFQSAEDSAWLKWLEELNKMPSC